MKIAYFDPFSGAAGDMILGALIDAGYPFSELEKTIGALGLPELSLRMERVLRQGLGGSKIDVIINPPEGHVHRGIKDIEILINRTTLPEKVKALALKIFWVIAEAEAEAHRMPVEKVHFHEVGALDALADIVGSAAGIEWFGFDRVVVGPFSIGSGTVDCAHGTLPVPVPATTRILAGVPTRSSGIEGEMVTPTGAAILTTVADEFGSWPSMKPVTQGFGAGTKEFKGRPNLLRLVIGETGAQEGWERIDLLSATIDDMNPEILGSLNKTFLEAGAADSWLIPIQMKKGRPGILLQVLAHPDKTRTLIDLIVTHTTSLGVRVSSEQRFCLFRESKVVTTKYGDISVKTATLPDGSKRSIPEFEDCRSLAEKSGVPVMDIYREAMAKS